MRDLKNEGGDMVAAEGGNATLDKSRDKTTQTTSQTGWTPEKKRNWTIGGAISLLVSGGGWLAFSPDPAAAWLRSQLGIGGE